MTTAEIPAGTLRRTTLAAAIGNTVETYDYAVYGFLATVLAKVFFPASSPGAALLSSFAVFGSAFLARPAGALIFGPLADRLGRRPALVASLLLMAGATTVIGLLPSTASIGLAAPIVLVLLRFVQGLAGGAEYTTAIIYVAEFAPPQRSGALASRVQVGSLAGFLIGAVVVLTLNAALPPHEVLVWGWRVPFLLALPLGAIGLYLRSRLGETPEFLAAHSRVSEKDTTTAERGPRVPLLVGVSVLHIVGIYMVYTYLQSYLIQLHLSAFTATVVIGFALLAGVFLVVAGGRAADRKGRPKALLATSIGVLVLTYPLFAALSSAPAPPLWLVVCCTVLLSAGPAFYSGVAPITFVELVPVRVRGSVIGVSYNVVAAVLGGSAVFICQALVELTGDTRAPAYLLMAAATASAIAALTLVRRPAGHPYPSTVPMSAEAAS